MNRSNFIKNECAQFHKEHGEGITYHKILVIVITFAKNCCVNEPADHIKHVWPI